MFSSTVIDIPRPFVDPVESVVQALTIASLVTRRPRRGSTLALILDSRRRGLGVVAAPRVDRTTIHSLVGACCDIPRADSIVVVSVRRGIPVRATDVELHARMSFALAAAGFTLLDWIVACRGSAYCPRIVVGAPDPWTGSVPAP